MKYMNSHRHERLVNKLFDKKIALQEKGETNIKQYEIAFQDAIEEVCPGKCWWQVTKCDIFTHLMEHRNPTETIMEILRKLKED